MEDSVGYREPDAFVQLVDNGPLDEAEGPSLFLRSNGAWGIGEDPVDHLLLFVGGEEVDFPLAATAGTFEIGFAFFLEGSIDLVDGLAAHAQLLGDRNLCFPGDDSIDDLAAALRYFIISHFGAYFDFWFN